MVETPAADLPEELRLRLDVSAGESLYLLYAHMEAAPAVELGESVSACQPLGTVGKSGNAGVAHLHLETRRGPPGVQFTEMGFYLASSTEEERSSYVRWRTGGEFVHFDPMLLLQAGE
jgi:murein DD-endopeptidase MepM/ murein hydrolase activator NlpD